MTANSLGIVRGIDFAFIDCDSLMEFTFGLRRFNSEKLLRVYHKKGIFQADPFNKVLDLSGVGVFLSAAVTSLR